MLTWVAGAWGVFAGLVLSVATAFYAEQWWHVNGIVNLGALLAVVGLPLLVWLTARLAESGWTGLAPWSSWIIGTVVLGTRTSQGGLILLGDLPRTSTAPADHAGPTVLYAGTLIGAVAVGVMGTRTKARPSAVERPALPVTTVGDDDAEGEQGIAQPI